MVATSGAQLLPEDAIDTLTKTLLPQTTILTPNLPEAVLLLKHAGRRMNEPESADDVAKIACEVQKLGPKYVLLKGGHLPMTKGRVISKTEGNRHLVLNSKNTHGTGCSLASAIASNLASGMPMIQAVRRANQYVAAGIRTSQDLGKGSGPINHFHSTYTLPFAPGHFIDYMLDREDVKGPWREHTEHDFVRQMADGTLPLEQFKYYLIQDYLFLIHFSRANALLAYKSKSMEDLRKSSQSVVHLQEEMKLHIEFCRDFGLSPEEIEDQEESQACTAYTRYVLDVGQVEDWFGLQIALLPCLLGYGMIARRLHDDSKTVREGNLYTKWIDTYIADDYEQSVKDVR
ncbi:hypothetical protein LTS18_005788, partial [Coniosporium uncinatum]